MTTLHLALGYGLPVLFLAAVTVTDLRDRRIPNVLVYPALLIAPLLGALLFDRPLIWLLAGGALSFGLFYLVARLRPGDLGGGDIKLAGVIGLFLGFPAVLWGLLVAALAGGLVAALMLITKRGTLETRIPYGPFLAGGALIAMLWQPFPPI